MSADVSPVSPAVFAKRFLTALVVVSVISALTLAFAYQQAESKVSHLRNVEYVVVGGDAARVALLADRFRAEADATAATARS